MCEAMQFLRLYVRLIVGCLVLVGITRWFGFSQPNPANVLFTNPDGSACSMPCLFGVRPDTMTVDQALAVLAAHPLTRKMRLQKDASTPVIDIASASGRQVYINIYSGDPDLNDIKHVRSISIQLRQDNDLPDVDSRLADTLRSLESGAMVFALRHAGFYWVFGHGSRGTTC